MLLTFLEVKTTLFCIKVVLTATSSNKKALLDSHVLILLRVKARPGSREEMQIVKDDRLGIELANFRILSPDAKGLVQTVL